MFLATTGLIESWDLRDELLLLGPWCLRYDQRAVWSRLRWTMLQNPWDDPASVREAAAYCERIIDATLLDLTDALNELHGTRWSARYWRILLGPWLLYYVPALYDRYERLKRARAAFPGLATALLPTSCYRRTPDTLTFMRQVQGSEVRNLQLCSQIVRGAPFASTLRWTDLPEERVPQLDRISEAPARAAGQRQSPLPHALRRAMHRQLVRVLRPRVMLGGTLLHRQDAWRVLRAMALRGGALPAPNSPAFASRDVDARMRDRLRQLPARDVFSAVLVETLPHNFPVIFLEGYAAFRQACRRQWPSPPRVVFSSVNWYGHEGFKFLAAEFGETATRLVGAQHGGGYGTYEVHPNERFELSITDRWCSFGWDGATPPGRVRPLPHPRFVVSEAAPKPPAKEGEAIVLVTTSPPRYPVRFDSTPVGQFETVLAERIRFLQRLPPAYRRRVVVRLDWADYGWCHRQRLLDACGETQFSAADEPLHALVARARLVVIEYPGTAYLEVLAANVPILLCWSQRLWPVRETEAPYFAALRAAGIWCEPERAAERVAALYPNPWAWWETAEVQEARERFVERHALGRADWVRCWTTALAEEIRLSDGAGRAR